MNMKITVDYELIPAQEIVQNKNDMSWWIRIKTGKFSECVIKELSLGFPENETDDITFNYTLHFSPDPDLQEDDPEFQEHIAEVVANILEDAAERARLE